MDDLEHYMEAVSRLRAENERLTRHVENRNQQRDELLVENKRLREALEDIADKYGDVASAEIARAALQSEKGMEEALRGSGTYNERWKSKP